MNQIINATVAGLRGPGLTPEDLTILNGKVAEASAAAAETATNRALAQAAAEVAGDGISAFADTFAELASRNLPDGTVADVFRDESRGGSYSRYRIEGGQPVFKVELSDIVRGALRYLTLTGDQDVSGIKHFANGLRLFDGVFKQESSQFVPDPSVVGPDTREVVYARDVPHSNVFSIQNLSNPFSNGSGRADCAITFKTPFGKERGAIGVQSRAARDETFGGPGDTMFIEVSTAGVNDGGLLEAGRFIVNQTNQGASHTVLELSQIYSDTFYGGGSKGAWIFYKPVCLPMTSMMVPRVGRPFMAIGANGQEAQELVHINNITNENLEAIRVGSSAPSAAVMMITANNPDYTDAALNVISKGTNRVNHDFARYSDGTQVFAKVRADGSHYNRTGIYAQDSDRKLKQDIVPASAQLADVRALASIMSKFRLKSDPDGPLMLGWVAQDVEAVAPGLVHETEDLETYDEPAMQVATEAVETPLLRPQLGPNGEPCLGDDGQPVMETVRDAQGAPVSRWELRPIIDDNGAPVMRPEMQPVLGLDGLPSRDARGLVIYSDVPRMITKTRPNGERTKSVSQSVAFLKLFKAFGEAMDIIDALESRIAHLEKAGGRRKG